MNRYKPLTVILLVMTLAGCASSSRRFAGTPVVRPVDERAAAAAISAYRKTNGLGPVRVDATLNGAALQQAKTVAAAGELSHGDFSGRMSGLAVDAAWENLGMGPSTIGGAIHLWKESPGHNRNLLAPQATRIGIARVDAEAPYWALVLAR